MSRHICVKLTKTGDGPFPEFVVSDERTGEILGIESHIRIVGIARVSMAENGETRVYPSPEAETLEYEDGTIWAT